MTANIEELRPKATKALIERLRELDDEETVEAVVHVRLPVDSSVGGSRDAARSRVIQLVDDVRRDVSRLEGGSQTLRILDSSWLSAALLVRASTNDLAELAKLERVSFIDVNRAISEAQT